MQKHKPFHIECKNEEECKLLLAYLELLGCILYDTVGIKFLDGLLIEDGKVFNPSIEDAESNYGYNEPMPVFTISDLPEIKKTLETPVYEVGDWVKFDNSFIACEYMNGAVARIKSTEYCDNCFTFETPDGYELFFASRIARLATPEEIEEAQYKKLCKGMIDKFSELSKIDFYNFMAHKATPEEIEDMLRAEADKEKAMAYTYPKYTIGCDTACGEHDFTGITYIQTGLSSESRKKLRKELLDWYNKKDDTAFADPLFKIIMSSVELNQILNKY